MFFHRPPGIAHEPEPRLPLATGQTQAGQSGQLNVLDGGEATLEMGVQGQRSVASTSFR